MGKSSPLPTTKVQMTTGFLKRKTTPAAIQLTAVPKDGQLAVSQANDLPGEVSPSYRTKRWYSFTISAERTTFPCYDACYLVLADVTGQSDLIQHG